MIPVECVVSGYLLGGAWRNYCAQDRKEWQGLPSGLRHGSKLPWPVFTPSRKNVDHGKDLDIPFSAFCAFVSDPTARHLRDRAVAIYKWGERWAQAAGLVYVNSKLEFGRTMGWLSGPDSLVLADEMLTPAVSRIVPRDALMAFLLGRGPQPQSLGRHGLRDFVGSMPTPFGRLFRSLDATDPAHLEWVASDDFQPPAELFIDTAHAYQRVLRELRNPGNRSIVRAAV